MRFDLVLNTMVLSFFREKLITVQGGEQWRPLVHVADSAAAFICIAEAALENVSGQIFNVGNPKSEMSIRALAHKLRELYVKHPLRKPSRKISAIKVVHEKNYYGKGYQDIQRRMPSIKKAHKLLGWKPKVDLATSLKKTLDYFLQEHQSTQTP